LQFAPNGREDRFGAEDDHFAQRVGGFVEEWLECFVHLFEGMS